MREELMRKISAMREEIQIAFSELDQNDAKGIVTWLKAADSALDNAMWCLEKCTNQEEASK